jgi:hypothetical protein
MKTQEDSTETIMPGMVGDTDCLASTRAARTGASKTIDLTPHVTGDGRSY